jgi:nucleoside-diphosphate-sugar epimerase
MGFRKRALESLVTVRERQIVTSGIVREDIQNIVRMVGGGVDRLSGKALLITGGTGFIGSYLLQTALYLNDHVLPRPCRISLTTRDARKLADRFPALRDRSDLTVIETDIKVFQPGSRRWDFMIHAAGASDTRRFMQDPLETMATIVEGTQAVLKAATDSNVESFLFLSSGAVYGHQSPGTPRLSEDYAGGPDLRLARSCYAEAKRYAEMLCRSVAEVRKLPVTIARVFTLVGPYQDLNSTSAVIDFIRQALDGDTITIRDAGQTVRSYCYIADAVAALWRLLLRREHGEVFNVGSDLETVSFVELAHRVGKCLGKAVTVQVGGGSASGVLGDRYAPDVSRLLQKEGFRPATSLDEALRRTIVWMREQRALRQDRRGVVPSR